MQPDMSSKSTLPVTIVIPVLNEERSVESLIWSIEHQGVHPQECIIVDGGSTDATVAKVQSYASLSSFKIELLVLPGANIAKARNCAILNSKTEVMACTDAGCQLDQNWLYEITKDILQGRAEIVAGVTQRGRPRGFLEQVSYSICNIPIDEYRGKCITMHNFVQQINASSRSIAFTKRLWRLVGGYPEGLRRCGEDTLFNYKVVSQGYLIHFNEKAVVTWENERTLGNFLKKNVCYGYGDGQSGVLDPLYARKAVKAVAILAVFLFLIHDRLTPLVLVLIAMDLYNYYRKDLREKHVLRNPVLFLSGYLAKRMIEVAKLLGFGFGKLNRV